MIPKFVNTSYFFNICDHIYPLSLPKLHGDLVFVHPDHLTDFIEYDLEKIQVRFILVSAMSDSTIPNHYEKESDIIENNSNIIYWYSTNCIQPTQKRRQIPIGLSYQLDQSIRIICNNPVRIKDSEKDITWKQDEEDILTIYEMPCEKREGLCYGNFHFSMITLYAEDRKDALEKIPSDLIDYESSRITKKETFLQMKKYKYVVSPFGNGFDCHRTWEALILGCIPIIKSSGLDPMFEGLPVLIVNSWSDVTQERLQSFIPKKTQLEKLTMKYWIECLNSARKDCL